MAMGSCSKEVWNEDAEGNEGASVLRLSTRSGDGTSEEISQSLVYLFNKEGQCVARLSADEGTYASAKLDAGTYEVYAIGSDDLSRYNLPEAEDATLESKISPIVGKKMGDLLTAHQTVTLDDGDRTERDIVLQRKVMAISEVSISMVPEDVTGVEVRIAPLYAQIGLDGTFSEADATGIASITLSKTEDASADAEGVWKSQSEVVAFPSKGIPTVDIYFTRPAGVTHYSYTAPQELTANHKVKLKGTYTEQTGVILSGGITAEPWGDNQDIEFEFDDKNKNEESGETNNPGNPTSSSDAPVVGQTYKTCYVISVNENAKTAVLLSPTESKGYTDQAEARNALSSWPAVEGITGTWRIPTLEEISVFFLDNDACDPVDVTGKNYYCMNGSIMASVNVFISQSTHSNTIGKVKNGEFGYNIWLRPVIDITY